jgi:DNA invertase Pin-like site-specific DNA recombinase
MAIVRCAIYTRKSSEEGLSQTFNSLDAQREAAEAYILSQREQGWAAVPERYDDGGFTGGNMDRPALQRLLADIEASRIDCVIVYKVDRLSRSLLDFARILDSFEQRQVSFVSVTQQFNTSMSLGRLTLNILLSFAQFEREIIAERTRDKMAAARRKGKWVGGIPVLGYDVAPQGGRLVVNPQEAEQVRNIFNLYLNCGSVIGVVQRLSQNGWTTKQWMTKSGKHRKGRPFNKNAVMALLSNVVYTGQVCHQGQLYPGEHEAILDRELWNEANRHLCENSARLRSVQKIRAGSTPIQTQPAQLECGVAEPVVQTLNIAQGARHRLPRIARLLALAIKLEKLVREGTVRDYAELARLGHVTRARITQIMSLCYLAPDIQESILFSDAESRIPSMAEGNIRHIAKCIHWDEQRRLWRDLVPDKT